VTQSVETPQFRRPVRWLTGIVLLILVGLVTVGGIKRIAHVAMVCVPFMCILYMLAALVIIIMYAPQIPAVIALVVKRAFTAKAAGGGAAGVGVIMVIRWGIARGVFSNEAGLGSAPMAHATAQTDHPVRQGLWGIFEVFFDTIVMCSATALVILLTGAWTGKLDGAALTIHAFSVPFGATFGPMLVTFCMILTAYDTILAWCFYGETCSSFIFGHGRVTRTVYRIVWLPFILIGAIGGLKAVWGMADILNGLMAIPNLIALLALTGVVVKLTKGFLAKEPYAPLTDAADGSPAEAVKP
jgi:AGCS family alanine or glycine:cation symporter